MTENQTTSESTKKLRYLPTGLSTQIILAPLFMLLGLLEAPIIRNLTERNFHPALINSVAPAFLEYEIFILLVAIFLIFATVKWKQQLFGRETPSQISIIVFSFFAYFLAATRILQFPFSMDDSYIDYRYAVNTLRGFTLQYNPGENTVGFSSHLHAWWLILVAGLFPHGDVSRLSQISNATFQLLSYFIALPVFTRIFKSQHLALLGCVLISSSSEIAMQGASGKESSIVLFLLLILLYAVHDRRPQVIGWSSVLLALARPEGVFLLPLSFLETVRISTGVSIKNFLTEKFSREHVQCLRSWFEPLSRKLSLAWFPPLTLACAWFVYLQVTFGTIVPHGGIAKALVFTDRQLGQTFLEILINFTWFLMPTRLAPNFQGMQVLIPGFIVFGIICLLAMRSSIRFYCQLVVLIVAFYSITNPYLFYWYCCWFQLIPPLLGILLVKKLTDLPRPQLAMRLIATAAIAILIVVPWLSVGPRRSAGLLSQQSSPIIFGWDSYLQRLLFYRDAANDLETMALPGDTVAVAEVGVFGYSYDGPVLDVMGLVSDSVLKYYPVPDEHRSEFPFSVPTRLMDEVRPNYFLTFDGFIENGVLKDPEFRRDYELIKKWPLSIFNSEGLELYRLKDVISYNP